MTHKPDGTVARWNQTRVSKALEIEYPIIQGPLGGFSSQKLTAAVSNLGGLGSFGAHGLEPSAIGDVISEIRSLTSRPFAMNLWVSMEDEGATTSDSRAFASALSPLAHHIESVGGVQPTFTPYVPMRFDDQVRVLITRRCLFFPSSLESRPRRSLMSVIGKPLQQSGLRPRRKKPLL